MAMENKFAVGVRHLVIAKMATETSSAIPTYGAKLDVGATNSMNFNRSTNSATADGDDAQVANITMTTGGTLEWTGWGVPDETAAVIYGHTIESGVLKESMGDLAPYCGVGYIRTMADKTNTWSYTAYWYYKAQAVQGSEESTTSGSNLTLNGTPVTFNVVQPSYGSFRDIKSFTTEADAISWLEAFVGTAAGASSSTTSGT